MLSARGLAMNSSAAAALICPAVQAVELMGQREAHGPAAQDLNVEVNVRRARSSPGAYLKASARRACRSTGSS